MGGPYLSPNIIIRDTILPLIRNNVHDDAESITEVTRVHFRPIALVLYNPHPDLYIRDIYVNNYLCFAASGEVPSMMFGQKMSKRRRVQLHMPSLSFNQHITVKWRNKGNRLIVPEGYFAGLMAE